MSYKTPTLDNLNSMQKLLIGIDHTLYITTGRTGVYTSLSGVYVKHSEIATSGGAVIDWNNIVNVPLLSGVGVDKIYVDSQDTALSGYCEGAFVNISGDAMTGFLVLNADPVNPLQAATKQYVDSQVTSGYITADAVLSGILFSGYKAADLALSGALQSDFVNISGDTMTGFLTLHANPTLSGHAATKRYVDAQGLAIVSGYQAADTVLSGALASGYQAADVTVTNMVTSGYQAADVVVTNTVTSGYNSAISTYSGIAEGRFVNVSGDTMTGFLTLNADPTASGHAANKAYVDAQLAASGANFVHLTGDETISGTKTFASPVVLASGAEPTATGTGLAGEVRWADDFVYICVASNVWKRAALSDF